ncbi:MAG TPA: chemotaxis protein CheW, partial [Gemmatimonadaceae bacterium]|nr:chemotaxis protein CheW [Gemmatimonadaceae bacterium]
MSSASGHQLVTFRLDGDLFAADIFAVERVLRYQEPTAVPDVPSWIAGVMEYQGRIVPVIDLRARFELPASPPQIATRILIFVTESDWVGAVVDSVMEVVTVPAAQVAPPPPLFRGLSAEYVRGIVRRDERLMVYLDVARLLTAS